MATGATNVRATAKAPSDLIPPLPGLMVMIVGKDAVVGGTKTGTAHVMPISGVAPNMVLTDPTASFSADDIGTVLEITGASNAGNNKSMAVTAQTATTLTFLNPTGVAEAGFAGTWRLLGRMTQVTDRVGARTWTQPTVNLRPPMFPASSFSTVPTTKSFGRVLSKVMNANCSSAAWAAFDGNVNYINWAALFTAMGPGNPTGAGSGAYLFSITNVGATHFIRYRITGGAGALTIECVRSAASQISIITPLTGYAGGRATVGSVFIPVVNGQETWVNGAMLASNNGSNRAPLGLAEFLLGDLVGVGNAQGIAALAVAVGARWTATEFAMVQNYFNAVVPP